MARKPRKVRADFRKNRTARPRGGDLTRKLGVDETATDDAARDERISGKGELTRRRTVLTTGDAADGDAIHLDVDLSECLGGRILRVQGLHSDVQTPDGKLYRCATRRILKTLTTDLRHVVCAGDLVQFRPAGQDEGIIERVERRHGVLSRTSKGRQQTIVANVDQLLIVGSAAEPTLKPNLIDRFLVAAEKGGIRPVIVINKIDLVEPADLQPLVGVYAQMGYTVLLTSSKTGVGIDRLRRQLAGQATALAGQSGVGKSSLLNAIETGLALRVSHVSAENQKGRHTTTTAELLPLVGSGYVIDTPGIRQFQLWDVTPAEVAGYFRDLRPFVSHCRFPDCTHRHEEDCAVKDAVADDLLDARRYESYLAIFEGDYA
ncbi:MAG: ribosome small subunit-dependent GTPase A [Pirellulales bacterium]